MAASSTLTREEPRRTATGLTVHRWTHPAPAAGPLLLIHGFGSHAEGNWVQTGWLRPLAALGRDVLAVDLPGHGASADVDPASPAGTASGPVTSAALRAELAALLEHGAPDEPDAGAQDGSDGGSKAVVHGYSLGSRLAWELAAERPELVDALVLGGAPAADRLSGLDAAQARAWAVGGPPPQDPHTAAVVGVAARLPGQHLPHVVELLLRLAADPWDPQAAVPAAPTLVVAGSADEVAVDSARLARLVEQTGRPARHLLVPDRDHVNVLTARAYKQAVVEFLAEHAPAR